MRSHGRSLHIEILPSLHPQTQLCTSVPISVSRGTPRRPGSVFSKLTQDTAEDPDCDRPYTTFECTTSGGVIWFGSRRYFPLVGGCVCCRVWNVMFTEQGIVSPCSPGISKRSKLHDVIGCYSKFHRAPLRCHLWTMDYPRTPVPPLRPSFLANDSELQYESVTLGTISAHM